MKLEFAVDEDPIPWRPGPETVESVRRMVENCGPADGVLEVVLTSDARVRQLNSRYRNKDRATDVLSFSYLEGHEPFRSDLLHRRRVARDFSGDPTPPAADPADPDEAVLVGQVLIGVETMLYREIRRDHSDDEEFVFLVIHGMLHTLGYDHHTEEEARQMEMELERILCKHGGMEEGRVQ